MLLHSNIPSLRISQSNGSLCRHIRPNLSANLFLSCVCSRDRIPCRLRLLLLLLCYFLHRSFHPVGILYRQCQSPVVTERVPGPRPLSLVHPTMLGPQRERLSPLHRTVLMRTNSLPSQGLSFPADPPPVGSRLIDGSQEDDCELREYFC